MILYRVRWFDSLAGWRQRWAATKHGARAVVTDVLENAARCEAVITRQPEIEPMPIGNTLRAIVAWLNQNCRSGNI